MILTFQLTVSDGSLSSAAMVHITIVNVNARPSANAGADQTANEGDLVTLDGSGSSDLDGEALTSQWTQTDGPAVALSNPTVTQPTFVVLGVGRTGVLLIFQLTVSDGLASASDTVTVSVDNVNHPPTAHAGPDQTRQEASVVTLDGRGSQDPDGDPLSYAWSQRSGPVVTMAGASPATPTFVAPPVGPGGATLVFRLVVSDGLAESLPADVTITVLNVNDPPVCERATASPAVLWPPNHKLVPVTPVGVSDPDNDQVTLTVTGVTQDEPVNGLGEGDTSPDARLQQGQLALRAERAGTGNGRVYRVSFTATDGRDIGGSCTGSVTVCVPHDAQGTCVDEGERFNAFRS